MYCTIAQVKARNSLILGGVSDARITEAIQGADSYIDGKLTGRYVAPLTSAPALIRELSADIAAGRLLMQATGQAGFNGAPEQATALLGNATLTLNEIRSGQMGLVMTGADALAAMPGYSNTYEVPRQLALNGDPSNPRSFLPTTYPTEFYR